MPRSIHNASCVTPGGSSLPTVIVEPSADLSAAVNAAIATLEPLGGGIIQLTAGTHYIAPETPVYLTASNITIQGTGPSTVVECHMANNQWAFQVIGDTVIALDCSNTTQGQTQITITTHEQAATRLAGVPIMIIGTDSNGMRRIEPNFAAADGNGDTGVITLVTPLTMSLTSVKMRSYGAGQNVTFRDFKIYHNEAVTSHSFGVLYSYRCSLINIEGDGGGATTGSMNFASIGGNLYPTMTGCTGYDYNTVEHYLGTDGCKGVEWPDDNYGGVFTHNNFTRCGSTELAVSQLWAVGAIQESCTWAFNELSNPTQDHLLDIGSTAYLSNCHFDDNTLNDGLKGALYCRNGAAMYNTTFNRNTIDTVTVATFWPGLYIQTPTIALGIEVKGNIVTNVSAEAISVWGLGAGSEITGNTVTNCTYGVYPYLCNGALISENVCNGLTAGIYLYNTDNCTISDNFCNNCTGYGIRSDGSCSGLIISGNELKNGVNGMRFLGADDDIEIDGNIATGNSTSNLFIGDSNSNFNITNNDLRTGTVTLGSGTNIVFGAGNLVD